MKKKNRTGKKKKRNRKRKISVPHDKGSKDFTGKERKSGYYIFTWSIFPAGSNASFLPLREKKEDKATEEETNLEQSTKNEEYDAYIEALENKLEQTIGGMEGAGKVLVMITLKNNGEKILDKNQPYENESSKNREDGKESETSSFKSDQETVLIEKEGDTEPIVVQEMYPEIEGVVVVCEGGDNTALALHIKEAVQALFSIDAHNIVVCKLQKEGK